YRYYYQAPEPPPVRDGNAYQSGLSEGYLISDKPVYRALDTLKLKAFLTEPRRGRPIRRKAWLSISEPMQNFNLTRKLKPVSPGAFVFNWPIPDSFKIDRNLNMSFNYRMKGFNLSKSYSVYLENYQLDQNNYELLLHNEIYYAGEDIAYSVVANDANGFPIPGTQIHCKLSIQNIFEFLGDSLKLSAARKANWYSFDTLFPYEASMALKIPSNLLPEANATYLLEVTFTDPVSYERKVLTKSFTKYLAKEKLLFYQQEDSLHIRNLYNLHDTNRSYRLISLSNKDTLFNRMITTPCHIQLSPFNTRFVLIDKDSVATPVDIVFNQLNIVHLNGKRSGDSLQVDFHFPFEEAVYYQLLKNGKRVQSGKTRVLRFRVADKSKDAYTLRFSHNILKQIDQNFYEAVFIPRLHTIQLESNLPSQAWPGQLIPVEIKASDYRNRPLKKINIAAFAVNKQFAERLRTPEITIPQQYKDILDIQPVSFQPPPQLYISVADNRLPLKYWHFRQLRLRKNEYYALAYPERDYTVLSGTIQSAIPEFSVTMMHGNKLYRPKYIMLDNQPVYLTDLQKDVYSFPLSAGNHTISIRYFNKRIDLPVMTFAKNKKYWIGLNYDSL
ncbi:MAG TPA: hypothetical protein PLP14_09370, partial [Chitinophagaceae bacterium]|nr:hypothetical protein [Chitinophagaceae bacterium]